MKKIIFAESNAHVHSYVILTKQKHDFYDYDYDYSMLPFCLLGIIDFFLYTGFP
jgi:hypothetical protein